MKNKIEPEVPLIDFKTIRENVERRIRRRRTRSSPSESSILNRMEEEEQIKNDAPTSKTVGETDKPNKHRQESLIGEGKHFVLDEDASEKNRGKMLGDNATVEEISEIGVENGPEVGPKLEGFRSLKRAVSKWIDFTSTRRDCMSFLKDFEKLNLKKIDEDGSSKTRATLNSNVCSFLDEDIDGYVTVARRSIDETKRRKVAKSKELIHYFVSLARDEDKNSAVNLDYVERLLLEGADPNHGDKHGQTVLHEVARIWHTDVARFFIENGSEVDKVDHYGRSPLHVASAVDFSDMVQFLISNGADVNLRTSGENQTPIHYAAKNDACSSLVTLLRNRASLDDRDFKDRTPLQLGAELDRSEACKILLNEGAPAAVCDDSGMSCMSLMILKMPPVALEALDQFHIKDRANRKQYFYLSSLETPLSFLTTEAKSSLKVAVEENQFSIIMHPVMQRLVEVKWDWFGKLGACFQFATNLLFCIIWTVLMCTLPNDPAHQHSPMPEMSYHIVLEVLVVLILFYWIVAELREYRNSIRQRDEFIRWRENELTRDIKFCHPRWPEERAYIEREIAELAELKPSYLVDWWNYFDWLTYLFIFSTIICHFVSISTKSIHALNIEKAIGSAMLVLQWTRLMKFVRAFKPLGPFVVILRHVISDTGRFAFLFFIFYIPYAAALWVLFGKRSVTGYSNFEELAYNLLQITVVGDFGFSDLSTTNGRMARLLCGTYIVVSGIVCLNLFIALLSDTFQRVYDNAQANAQMLRASRVLNFEDNFSRLRRERYQRRLHKHCSPEISYYDDDMTDAAETELKRMTHQIKNEVDLMKEYLLQRFGTLEGDKTEGLPGNHRDKRNLDEDEMNSLRREIDLLKTNQEHSLKIINMQLLSINSMLAEMMKKKKGKGSRKGLGSSQRNTSSENTTENVVRVVPILYEGKDSMA